ncbi:hypothetical protein SFRURICE_003371 [Spodoptera frugiperda]|nr:hypothetical protein SFRURICE_003371 [Spodoptera frugiperda]
MIIPSPFVYWAQTESTISLKIELKNVVDPDVKVLENNLKFSAEGIGARGESLYEFKLDLFSPVKNAENNHVTTVRVFENRVDIVLQKEEAAWWPRLTAQPQKPAWLKINFDLWKAEDAADSEDEKRDVMKDYPGMYDRLHKEELGYRREDLKKVYLKLYNLFQFIGYTYVLTVMAIRYAKLDYDSVADTYEHVGPAMKFLQLLQYLEVMHPLFGYTRGGVLVPFLQVSGRAFVYPYYISQLYKKDFYILTWLRYTMWIPLYPIGIICEAIVILRNIPYFEETQRFTVSLPNEWNFAFHMPTFLRVYLLFLTFPGMYFVMSHMHKLRTVKLKPKIVIKKSK